MANEKNLVPANRRSKNEARENGRKGGLNSGKSRRRRKALRTMLKEAVSLPLSDLPEDLKAGIMKAAQIKDDSLLVSDAVLGSLIRTACKGNSQMMRLLLDTLGESADIRMKAREIKLKEKVAQSGTIAGAHENQSAMEQLIESIQTASKEYERIDGGDGT
ncbi:hypothetical protein [Megasphaera sp.]|uniref:hypothetical protein n=1 Tax=Megasphaera sp. TaxID=2023260 RepID=UPI003FF0D109